MMEEKKGEYKILFVCLGNICRSPSAEAVMKKLVQDAGLDGRIKIDSAGIIGYHAGEKADPRMRSHAARRGYKLDSVSRPVCTEDFFDFDLIIGMDNRNIDDLKRKAPDLESVEKIHQMTEYSPRTSCMTMSPIRTIVERKVSSWSLICWRMLALGYWMSLYSLFLQIRITDSCMVHDLQFFHKDILNRFHILERQRGITHQSVGNLSVYDLVD